MAFWLPLAVAIVLVGSSLTYSTLKVLEAFRAFKQLSQSAGQGLDRIGKASAEIERHLELAAAGGTRLEASLGRLQESRAQLNVLTSALAAARSSFGRFTGVFPRK